MDLLQIFEMKDEKYIKLLLDIKMPEMDQKSLDNNQKLIDFMNKGYKLSSPKNFINSVKFLTESKKFLEVSNKLNSKITCDHISLNNEEKRKKLSNQLDSLLEELESKFDAKMQQIEDDILLQKDNPLIYSIYNSSQKFVKDPRDFVYKEDICSSAHKTNSIDKVF